MENISNTENIKVITEEEIFSKIWLQPRKVFRFIEDKEFDNYQFIIWPIIGIISALGKAIDKNMGDTTSLDMILFINIFLGIFFGWISYFFYAVGISWTGATIGGKVGWKSIFRTMAYACIPFSFSLLIICIEIYLNGIALFQEVDTFYETPIGLSLIGINAILGIWSTVLMIVGISEVQDFPIWKAIINYLLPGLLLIGVIMLGFWIGTIL